MSGSVRLSELIPGDVFLYQGQGFISSMIRLLDGEPYSHASVFVGPEKNTGAPSVAEMLGNGVNIRPVTTSISGANYVDVYRYVNAEHKPLGSPEVDPRPLIKKIDFFTSPANRQRYGYEQILLLAMLCSTRKVSGIPGEIIRRVLDSASEVLAQLIHAGQEPMICSELVFRCYTEAAPPYELLIVGSDVPRTLQLGEAIPGGSSDHDDVRTRKAITSFLVNYSLAKGWKIPRSSDERLSNFVTMTVPEAVSMLAVADFVTPNDLGNSPNLQKLGTLSLQVN